MIDGPLRTERAAQARCANPVVASVSRGHRQHHSRHSPCCVHVGGSVLVSVDLFGCAQLAVGPVADP